MAHLGKLHAEII